MEDFRASSFFRTKKKEKKVEINDFFLKMWSIQFIFVALATISIKAQANELSEGELKFSVNLYAVSADFYSLCVKFNQNV